MEITFNGYICRLEFTEYNNRRPAIILIDVDDGQTVAVASVNVHGFYLDNDEIAIKDYSENEGMVECLIKYGIVSQPVRFCQSGFTSIPICKLLIHDN